MIYKKIREHVLDLASEDAGDDFEDMVKFAVNLIYFELLEETENDLERREFTLTTMPNKSKYGMPLYVQRVLNIEDATASRQLELVSAQTFDREQPGTTETGVAHQAYPLGDLE